MSDALKLWIDASTQMATGAVEQHAASICHGAEEYGSL